MNVTVENLAPCRKLVRVEVDPKTVDETFERITSEFQREVRLPGFRPGKAPRPMVERAYAKQIEDEVRRKLISENYKAALSEQKLDVVGMPDFEEIQFGRGQSLQFAATVDTAPEFELPEYKGLPVQRKNRTVSDEDVERALTVLREQRADYKDVVRPVQPGDFVVVNYTGTSEGKPLTDIAPTARGLTEQKNFWLHVQPGSFIPGFTEQLVGANAGERRTVTVDFPADFVAPALAGKPGSFDVEIVQVKEKVLPELNDELAIQFQAESAEKLREGVRADLQRELEFQDRKDFRNQLIKQLMERVHFELPETMVAAETRNVVYEIVRENHQRGVPKELIDQQRDEIFNAAANSAKDRVKVSFLFNRIAEREKIQVTNEEILQRVYHLSEQYQIKPEKMLKQLQERDGVAEIHEQILAGKVLKFLEQHANIQEVQ